MVKLILRLLLLVFLLESTSAMAVLCCPDELGLDSHHFSNSVQKHQHDVSSGDQHGTFKIGTPTDNHDDCIFCHLGAMKSMLPVMVLPTAAAEPAPLTDLLLSYPLILPQEPERPNWHRAV